MISSRRWRPRSRVLNNSSLSVMKQLNYVNNQVFLEEAVERSERRTQSILIHCILLGTEVEEQIEEHITKCINALAERRVVLLHEASQRVTNQSMIHMFIYFSSLLI